ncbi:hypothetical protein TIFTF001_033596 [Ficus carica]|uniref:Uncharacterized protein n=1 Tax=Ficus carica TaxID=3494 RepID=A0AA88J7C9_FICCA|nr:hypothetical protein TIFTF001_033596 [Ficus carica]
MVAAEEHDQGEDGVVGVGFWGFRCLGIFGILGLKSFKLTVKIKERNGEGRRNKKMEDLGQICSQKRRRAESWSRKFSEKMRKKEGSGGYMNIFSDGILSVIARLFTNFDFL